MTLTRWKSSDERTIEERLLFKYWQEVGGLIFAEVKVGGRGPGGIWPPGSKPRWIDAVRILPANHRSHPRDIVTFSKAETGEFEDAISEAAVEVIEVKSGLGRYVIGQVIIGADLLKMEYEPSSIDQVIVCQVGDPLLEMVCDNRGIKVWIAGG